MKYVDFKKFTDENGALPIYLFEGEEGYFRDKGEALLKERFLQEPTLDYVSFEGSALKGEKMKSIADALNCFPFISAKRVVRVTEFYPTEKDFELYLKDLFESLNIKTNVNVEEDKIINLIKNDKKADGDFVDLIVVEKIGEAKIIKTKIEDLRKFLVI